MLTPAPMMHIVATTAMAAVLALAAGCSRNVNAASEPLDKPQAAAQSANKTVDITVTAEGFTPSQIQAAKGQPLTLRFKRTSDQTCARDVQFPELGIKKELPLNQEVTVQVPTGEARKLTFQCGMGMYRSSVVIL